MKAVAYVDTKPPSSEGGLAFKKLKDKVCYTMGPVKASETLGKVIPIYRSRMF